MRVQTTTKLFNSAGDLVEMDRLLLATAFHDVHRHGGCWVEVSFPKKRRNDLWLRWHSQSVVARKWRQCKLARQPSGALVDGRGTPLILLSNLVLARNSNLYRFCCTKLRWFKSPADNEYPGLIWYLLQSSTLARSVHWYVVDVPYCSFGSMVVRHVDCESMLYCTILIQSSLVMKKFVVGTSAVP